VTTGPVSTDALEWTDVEHRDESFRRANLTAGTAAETLGCSCYDIPPGTRTWRSHYHLANEEVVYVLDGEGTIHLGPDQDARPLRPGTYVALPTGPAGTHEIAADGEYPLRLFVFSTMHDPDITVIPDDREAILTAGGAPGADPEDRLLSETVDLEPPTADPEELPDPASLVVQSESIEWNEYEHGERTFRRRQLGAAAGSEALGCSSYRVPPEKATWVRHWHGANEEALYVLEGAGTVRLGADAEEYDIATEDYVALPADERGTHEVTAGAGGLRYLVLSEMVEPEVTCYPDRDMLGIYVGSATGGDPGKRSISTYLDRNAELDYWDDD
jgi:uncharacterized cupin superfamily protein